MTGSVVQSYLAAPLSPRAGHASQVQTSQERASRLPPVQALEVRHPAHRRRSLLRSRPPPRRGRRSQASPPPPRNGVSAFGWRGTGTTLGIGRQARAPKPRRCVPSGAITSCRSISVLDETAEPYQTRAESSVGGAEGEIGSAERRANASVEGQRNPLARECKPLGADARTCAGLML